jgi:hypothetical protein
MKKGLFSTLCCYWTSNTKKNSGYLVTAHNLSRLPRSQIMIDVFTARIGRIMKMLKRMAVNSIMRKALVICVGEESWLSPIV